MLTAITGINWGDEGKGRMVDLISQEYDIVARYQGGNNAGHTVKNERGKFVLNLLPSGILRPNVVCVMGNGMVIDPHHLDGDVDFLTNMNDALASGAQVITGRKLVGNYTMGYLNSTSEKVVNAITCQNGLVWPIIDELGNRYKSALGLTTMPITTGILIRGDLVEEWGGWIYRQTLTEDMELQRDCACKGIKTFHYSFAKLYLEETPSHTDTNRRRTRWMTGMVAADRLYCRKLLKRRGLRASIDNYYILSLWLVYAYIGTLSVAAVFNLVTFRIWQAAAAFMLIYTAFFALSVMAVLADWKNIGLSWFNKLCLMLVHPFFYMEYILIVGRAVLGVHPKGWEKIGRVQY